MDELEFLSDLFKNKPDLYDDLIQWFGGPKQFTLHVALKLGADVDIKKVVEVLGLSESGSRKRLRKIKGKKLPKIDPQCPRTSIQNGPKESKSVPRNKKPN
jgi:hypothetical protein